MNNLERLNDFDDFDEEQFEKFRLTDHPEIGTAHALNYCVEFDVAPPRRLAGAARDVIIDLLKREKSARLRQYSQFVQ